VTVAETTTTPTAAYPAPPQRPPGSVFYDGDIAAAARAAVAEGNRAVFTFRCKGVTVDIPPAVDWPLGVLDAVSAGNIPAACRLLFPPDQWDALREAGATLADLVGLFSRLADWQGVTDLGK
jgi:transaldolase